MNLKININEIVIMFTLAGASVAFDVKCMDETSSSDADYSDNDAFFLNMQSSDIAITKLMPKRSALAILSVYGSYLTQLTSIYSIDSANTKVVDTLAKLRMLFNAIQIYLSADYLREYWCKSSLAINALKVYAGLGIMAKGYNVKQDYEIGNKKDMIALNNKFKKSDKNLHKKKLLHALWLTLNRFGLNGIGHFRKLTEKELAFGLTILGLSEIYRQYLMYGMIANYTK